MSVEDIEDLILIKQIEDELDLLFEIMSRTKTTNINK